MPKQENQEMHQEIRKPELEQIKKSRAQEAMHDSRSTFQCFS
jgi:hypothetical protein